MSVNAKAFAATKLRTLLEKRQSSSKGKEDERKSSIDSGSQDALSMEDLATVLNDSHNLTKHLEEQLKFYKETVKMLQQRSEQVVAENETLYEKLKGNFVSGVFEEERKDLTFKNDVIQTTADIHNETDKISEKTQTNDTKQQARTEMVSFSREDSPTIGVKFHDRQYRYKLEQEMAKVRKLNQDKTRHLESILTVTRKELEEYRQQAQQLKSHLRAFETESEQRHDIVCKKCGRQEGFPPPQASDVHKKTVEKLIRERDELMATLVKQKSLLAESQQREFEAYLEVKKSVETAEEAQLEKAEAIIKIQQLRNSMEEERQRHQKLLASSQDTWKQECAGIEKSYEKKMEDLKHEIELQIQRCDTVENQLDRVGREKVSLTAELERTKAKLVSTEMDIAKITQDAKEELLSVTRERAKVQQEVDRLQNLQARRLREHEQQKASLVTDNEELRRRLTEAQAGWVESREECIRSMNSLKKFQNDLHLVTSSKAHAEKAYQENCNFLKRQQEEREKQFLETFEEKEKEHIALRKELEEMLEQQMQICQMVKDGSKKLAQQIQEKTEKYRLDRNEWREQRSKLTTEFQALLNQHETITNKNHKNTKTNRKLALKVDTLKKENRNALKTIYELLKKQNGLMQDRQTLSREVEYLRSQLAVPFRVSPERELSRDEPPSHTDTSSHPKPISGETDAADESCTASADQGKFLEHNRLPPMNQRGPLEDTRRSAGHELRNMIGKEQELSVKGEDKRSFSGVWCLREEHEIASRALRKRSIDCDPNTSSSLDQHSDAMKSTMNTPQTPRRPPLTHRKTAPSPLREFVMSRNWHWEENKIRGVVEEKRVNVHPTISEEENRPFDVKKSILNDERFMISSYDLARRRLSLPLSTTEPCWREENASWDGDNTESLEFQHEVDDSVAKCPIKSQQRSSMISTEHSAMENKRRQSAWARRPSTYANSHDGVMRPSSKRRMSEELTKGGLWPPDPSFRELPALSALATRRRSVPHTLSVPVGLRRKGSRVGFTTDQQKINSACMRAKNEMLATLSMSFWGDGSSFRHHEMTRRKSCHTGFGIMALKKIEEKRLMVAHEILQTEKNYIKALETLSEVFAEPVKSSCVIPEKDVRTMFPKQLQAIKSGHEQFMNELNERLNNWKWQGVLGDIFAKLGNSYHVDFKTVYSEYVNNFPNSIAVINKYLRNSQKFRKLMEKCSNDRRCERLSISAFLLTPIQRLPRYVLLLRQLAKYTDPNHPDSFHIEISLEKMISTINLLNSSIQNSTRIARNTSIRHSRRSKRKRHIFKAKDVVNSEISSPIKSSDESEWSGASGPPTPCKKDASPLTVDIASCEQQNRSSDYASPNNSEATSEPTSPVPSGSSSKGNFLKVIRRNSDESKKTKRRPLSTTDVDIIRRKNETSPVHEELKRSASRDSMGSFLRNKFSSFRRSKRSSDEHLSRNLSLEKLHDFKLPLSKDSFSTPDKESVARLHEEQTACSKSDSDLLGDPRTKETTEMINSGSSMESCNGSPNHLLLSRVHASSDSEDSTRMSPDNGRDSRLDCDTLDLATLDNNSVRDEGKAHLDDKSPGGARRRKNGKGNECKKEKLARRKLGKRNSFPNVLKQFFVSKPRSSSNCSETEDYPEIGVSHGDKIMNLASSKEKISTV